MCALVKAKAEAAHFWLSSVLLKPEKGAQDCLSGPNKVVLPLRQKHSYKPFYRTQVYLGSDLWVRVSLTNKVNLC